MKQITIITGRSHSGKSTFVKAFAKNNNIAKTSQKWIDVKSISKNKKLSLSENIFTVFEEVCSESKESSNVIFIEDIVSLLDNDEQIKFAENIVSKAKLLNLSFVIVVNSLTFILAMKSYLILQEIEADCYVSKNSKEDDSTTSFALIEGDWDTNELLGQLYSSYLPTIGMLKQKEEEFKELNALSKEMPEEIKLEEYKPE